MTVELRRLALKVSLPFVMIGMLTAIDATKAFGVTPGNLSAISCVGSQETSPKFCAAVDGSGDAFTFDNTNGRDCCTIR